MSTPAPTDRIWRNGKRLSRRVWAILDTVSKETGLPVRVLQGSWSRGSLSAGTHTGGGAYDLSVRGMDLEEQIELTVALRKYCGNSVWLRSSRYGWPLRLGGAHIHGIVDDEPGLAYGAKRQVINARDRLNGLRNRGRDPFPRPARVRFEGAPIKVSKAVAVRLANLRYGKRNDDVKDLQHALKILADGVYGPKTDVAVRAHQKRMGLTPDPARKSYVGPKQARALDLGII